MRAKLQTILVVVVLSCLIWVFAERAITQSENIQVEVELAKPRPDLLIQFLDEQGEPLALDRQSVKLRIEGPGGRIQAVREKPAAKKVSLDVLKLQLRPQDLEWQELRVRVVEDLLNGKLRWNDADLSVTRAEPDILRVRVRKLTLRSLPIKVYDQQSGAELTQARVDPAQVDAYVIEGQTAEAKITLTAGQQLQAERSPVTVNTVALPYGTKDIPLKVILPAGGNPYPEAEIKVPRWGVLMPPAMVGKYEVVIENDSLLKEPITCRGATQAVAEYRNSRFHLVLEIKEKDETETAIDRPLHYYLPEGYGEIEIVNRVQGTLRFHLIPVPNNTAPPPALTP
jgi:hypothetical protein